MGSFDSGGMLCLASIGGGVVVVLLSMMMVMVESLECRDGISFFRACEPYARSLVKASRYGI